MTVDNHEEFTLVGQPEPWPPASFHQQSNFSSSGSRFRCAQGECAVVELSAGHPYTTVTASFAPEGTDELHPTWLYYQVYQQGKPAPSLVCSHVHPDGPAQVAQGSLAAPEFEFGWSQASHSLKLRSNRLRGRWTVILTGGEYAPTALPKEGRTLVDGSSWPIASHVESTGEQRLF